MRRTLALILLVLVTAFAVTAPIAVPSASAAQMFCTSSIDPRCQPANLPILIDAGVISNGSATAVSTTTTAGTAVAPLTTGSAVGVGGILGLGTIFGGAPVLGAKGFGGLVIKTDPSFTTPPSDAACSNVPGAPYSFTYDAFMDAPSLCIDAPLRILTGGFAPAGYLDFTFSEPYTTGSMPNVQGFIDWEVNPGFTPTLGTAGGGLGAYCQSTSTGQFELRQTVNLELNGSTFSPGSSGTLGCAGVGWQVVMVVWTHWKTSADGLQGGVLVDTTGTLELPEGGGTDVTGTLTGELTCRDFGTGNPYSVGIATAVNVLAGANFAIPDYLCDEGDIATGGTIDWTPSTGGAPVPLVPPTTVPSTITEIPNDYPDCFGPGVNPCKLELYKIGLGGQLESCGSIGQLCIGWAQLPDAAQSYRCFYGPYEIDLNACSAYRSPELGILPNVNEAGEWLPITAPPPNPLPNPVETWNPGEPVPGTTPGSGEETQARECWPTGWGVLNPFSWVYMPVSCALEWAFVPRESVMTATATQLSTALDDTAIAQVTEMVGGWNVNPSLTGCKISYVHWTTGQTIDVVNACDGPMATLAAMSRLLTFVTACILVANVVRRQIAAIVDYQVQ